MFDLPSRKDVNKCVVTKETIEKHLDPTLVTEGGQELDVTDELRENRPERRHATSSGTWGRATAPQSPQR